MSTTYLAENSSIASALCYGNFIYHYKKASEGVWKDRAVHVIIATIEALPIIGQIVALAEHLIGQYCIKDSTDKDTNYPKLAFDTPTILSLEETIQLKIYKHNNRSAIEEYKDSIFEFVAESMASPYTYITIRRKAPPLVTVSLPTPALKINLPYKRELTVSKIAPEPRTIEKLGKIARSWQNLSWDKKTNSSKETAIFDDLRTISKLIAQCMENPEETSQIWDSVFICEDVALKEIQGIALVKHSYFELKIAHIATHPNNVRSLANEKETTRVEGAGSALVKCIANYARSSKELDPSSKRVYLESVKSAESFYEKLGFEMLDPKRYPPEEPGTIPMLLTAQKIQSLGLESAISNTTK